MASRMAATGAGGLAAVAVIAFIGGRASVGVEGGVARAAQPEGQGEMEWGPPPPGPMHEHLKQMVGNWEGTVRFKMNPAADDWMESEGTVRRELAMGGRFVIEHVTGEPPEGMGDEEFKGMSIVGYNDIDGHYESVWIENMANHMSMSTGSYDENSKTFTFKGKMLDPMTRQRVDTEMMLDASDPDKEVWEGFHVQPDGTKVKTFEGEFERKR